MHECKKNICKFNVKHRECLRDHPSQRLMIKCLTIIQIEMEFGIDCGRFLFSPAPSLLTHPSPLFCQISDVTFQLTGYRERTELGKMFRIDYRRFLFSPPPSPNRSLFNPGAHSLVRSLRPEKEKETAAT